MGAFMKIEFIMWGVDRFMGTKPFRGDFSLREDETVSLGRYRFRGNKPFRGGETVSWGRKRFVGTKPFRGE